MECYKNTAWTKLINGIVQVFCTCSDFLYTYYNNYKYRAVGISVVFCICLFLLEFFFSFDFVYFKALLLGA